MVRTIVKTGCILKIIGYVEPGLSNPKNILYGDMHVVEGAAVFFIVDPKNYGALNTAKTHGTIHFMDGDPYFFRLTKPYSTLVVPKHRVLFFPGELHPADAVTWEA